MILTAGHSTKPIAEFTEMLRAHSIDMVADVRTVPRSRHNPQFNRDTLRESLRAAGIAYVHMPALGGLRKPRADSVNTGWRNASFRGYADYMQTANFAGALDALLEAADGRRAAVVCAEAVPWRCHRSLIADALAARGMPVEHILSAASSKPHTITPFARVEGRLVTYPSL